MWWGKVGKKAKVSPGAAGTLPELETGDKLMLTVPSSGLAEV